jgi:hypothetical protein
VEGSGHDAISDSRPRAGHWRTRPSHHPPGPRR